MKSMLEVLVLIDELTRLMVILEESVNLIIMMEVSAPIKSDYLMAMLGD